MYKATQSLVGIGEHGENLSIIVPAYNCASYAKETLLSLKAQECTQDRIEVVDDCSRRRPEALLEESGESVLLPSISKQRCH